MLAPAKLTVSLQVTGVRADGYHELDAEMVTLDLADELQIDEEGSGLTVEVEPGVRPDGLPGPGQNLVERALAACGGQRRRPAGQADPAGRRTGRGVGGRRRRAALGRLHRPRRGGAASAPTCRSAWSGAGPGSRGWGSRSRRCPSCPASTCCSCRPSASTPPRSTGPGTTTRRTRGPTRSTAAALAVEPRLARWRDALGDLGGSEPVLAGQRLDVVRRDSRQGPGRSAQATAWRPAQHEVRVGTETARLVRARTVPAGWEGD